MAIRAPDGANNNTLIYGISRDGSKNFNICTCEHMILGQLRMGARKTKNAPLCDTGDILDKMRNSKHDINY